MVLSALETWGQKVRAGQGSAGESGHLLLHVVGQLSVVVDVDEERECAPSIIPAAVTRCHVTSPRSHNPIMSKKIGRIGDWNNSQARSDGFVSQLHLSKATSNASNRPRQGSSGPRIATLRDTTQPDAPARHHASDDEDEDESAREEGESWFAGGERRLAFIASSTSILSLIRHL